MGSKKAKLKEEIESVYPYVCECMRMRLERPEKNHQVGLAWTRLFVFRLTRTGLERQRASKIGEQFGILTLSRF